MSISGPAFHHRDTCESPHPVIGGLMLHLQEGEEGTIVTIEHIKKGWLLSVEVPTEAIYEEFGVRDVIELWGADYSVDVYEKGRPWIDNDKGQKLR